MKTDIWIQLVMPTACAAQCLGLQWPSACECYTLPFPRGGGGGVTHQAFCQSSVAAHTHPFISSGDLGISFFKISSIFLSVHIHEEIKMKCRGVVTLLKLVFSRTPESLRPLQIRPVRSRNGQTHFWQTSGNSFLLWLQTATQTKHTHEKITSELSYFYTVEDYAWR